VDKSACFVDKNREGVKRESYPQSLTSYTRCCWLVESASFKG